MKSKKIVFISVVLGMIVSCSKTNFEDLEKSQKAKLLDDVTSMANSTFDSQELYEIEFYNYSNPFEKVGNATYNSLLKAYKTTIEKKTVPFSLKNDFIQNLNEQLPFDLLHPDTLNFDTIEVAIEDVLVNIFLEEGFYSYTVKSIAIEDIVVNADCLDEYQKKRILVFSSVLRHLLAGMRYIHCDIVGTKGSWEDCFKEKLQQLQDCKNCFIEKIICVFTWPTCLGIKALDCLIDVIF